MGSLKKKLKNVFGHDDYESALQKKACELVYREKRDALICTLNNSEKSLCMQLPSAAKKSKFAVVITPTRDFAKNQVAYLKSKNIPAFYWNACSSTRAKDYIKKQMTAENPEIKLLYMTYSQVLNSHVQFKLIQAKQNVSKFIINEADYLSPQTSEYRREYIKLGTLKKKFSEIPIVAFTSGTTERVGEDIIQLLHLKNPVILDSRLYAEKELNEHEVICLDSDSGESIEFICEERNTKKVIPERWQRFHVSDNKPLGEISNKHKHLTNANNNPFIKLFKMCGDSGMRRLVGEECPSCNSKDVNVEEVLKQIKMLVHNDSEDSDTIYISDDSAESPTLFSD